MLIRERKRVRGVKSTRLPPLSAKLAAVLKEWFEVHPGGLFSFSVNGGAPTRSKNRNGSFATMPDEAHDHFKRTLAGSRFERLRGWHVVRHSFCSNCAARGIDQRVINGWVAHQSEEMVQRYRHSLPRQSKDLIDLVFG